MHLDMVWLKKKAREKKMPHLTEPIKLANNAIMKLIHLSENQLVRQVQHLHF